VNVLARGHAQEESSGEVLARLTQVPQLRHRQEPRDRRLEQHAFVAEDKVLQHLGWGRVLEFDGHEVTELYANPLSDFSELG
jgi:hypothetical protein